MSLPPLEINAGDLTPYVLLDADKGVCVIKGRCIPENPNHYFLPILNWLDGLNEFKDHKIDLICKIQYFNTASAKYILEIFKRLEKNSVENNNQISVFWYFEEDDDDMKEAGEHFSDLTKLQFKFIEVSEEEFDS